MWGTKDELFTPRRSTRHMLVTRILLGRRKVQRMFSQVDVMVDMGGDDPLVEGCTMGSLQNVKSSNIHATAVANKSVQLPSINIYW